MSDLAQHVFQAIEDNHDNGSAIALDLLERGIIGLETPVRDRYGRSDKPFFISILKATLYADKPYYTGGASRNLLIKIAHQIVQHPEMEKLWHAEIRGVADFRDTLFNNRVFHDPEHIEAWGWKRWSAWLSEATLKTPDECFWLAVEKYYSKEGWHSSAEALLELRMTSLNQAPDAVQESMLKSAAQYPKATLDSLWKRGIDLKKPVLFDSDKKVKEEAWIYIKAYGRADAQAWIAEKKSLMLSKDEIQTAEDELFISRIRSYDKVEDLRKYPRWVEAKNNQGLLAITVALMGSDIPVALFSQLAKVKKAKLALEKETQEKPDFFLWDRLLEKEESLDWAKYAFAGNASPGFLSEWLTNGQGRHGSKDLEAKCQRLFKEQQNIHGLEKFPSHWWGGPDHVKKLASACLSSSWAGARARRNVAVLFWTSTPPSDDDAFKTKMLMLWLQVTRWEPQCLGFQEKESIVLAALEKLKIQDMDESIITQHKAQCKPEEIQILQEIIDSRHREKSMNASWEKPQDSRLPKSRF